MKAAQLRWQIQAIAFAAMQELRPQQTLELIKATAPWQSHTMRGPL